MKSLNERMLRVRLLAARKRQILGSVTGVVVTVLFIAMLAVLGLTQFTDMADQAEGDTAMTEVLRAMNNSGNYFISKGRDYTDMKAPHLGIAGNKNLYGKTVTLAETGSTATITYPGFPNEQVCSVVAGRLAAVPYFDTAACNAAGQLTVELDDSR